MSTNDGDAPQDLCSIADRLLEIIPHGLVKGLGKAVPGKLCVEAAICLALGEPHQDTPSCVASPDRGFAIRINDAHWSTNAARATALLPLALAQLGTAGADRGAWSGAVVLGCIREVLPLQLRHAVWCGADSVLLAHADACASTDYDNMDARVLATKQAASAAYADAASAAYVASAYAADAADSASASATYAADAAFAVTNAASAAATDAVFAAATDVRDFIFHTAVNVALDAYRQHPHPGMLDFDTLCAR